MELKYAFLEENKQCPVVISSLLIIPQEDNLLQLLKMNKQALEWKISDLKGISPTICTHHIYLEEESKAVWQPQRRLNPHMQEVVRIEVLELLQPGIISDSDCTRRLRKDHLYLSIWNLCLQEDAFWSLQRPCHLPEVYA